MSKKHKSQLASEPTVKIETPKVESKKPEVKKAKVSKRKWSIAHWKPISSIKTWICTGLSSLIALPISILGRVFGRVFLFKTALAIAFLGIRDGAKSGLSRKMNSVKSASMSIIGSDEVKRHAFMAVFMIAGTIATFAIAGIR